MSTIPRPSLSYFRILLRNFHQRHHPSLSFMRFRQRKVFRTGSDTAFAGFGLSALHIAFVTSFLSLHPAMKGYILDKVMHTPTVGNCGPISLDVHLKDPIHGIVFSDRHKIRDSSPTKTPRFKSTATTSSPPVAGNKAIPGIIFCASLVSVGIGAALVFGSYAQGGSSTGHGSSESDGDSSEQNSSILNGLGEFNPCFPTYLSDFAFL